MEDMNNPSQSMGVGQPHHQINHTRPFFYVQPPTQPYYNMHHWNMNLYGQSPSAMPYGRPYMAPYPYLQYPGYMVPQAPMQPVDYSRMFNPHIASATYDIQFRHHFQQQARVRRTTACSEAQTDPCDAIHELIDGLDRLATTKMPPGDRGPMPNANLTSNVSVSPSSSGTKSEDVEAEPSGQGRASAPRPLPQRQPQPSKRQWDYPVPSSVFSDSTCATVYDAESSQSCLEGQAKQDGWSVGSGTLPIDRDVHKDMESRQQYHSDKICLNTREPGIDGLSGEHPKPLTDNIKHEYGTSTLRLVRNGVSQGRKSLDCSSGKDDEMVLILSGSELKDAENLAPVVEDLPCQIPGMPFNGETVDMPPNDDPLLYVDSVVSSLADLPRSSLPMLGSAYYYSYYPPVAQDRQSVLSLSMDELSSRDELFSTDVDDLDLISGPVYMGGGKLAEKACNTAELLGKENLQVKSEERFAACSKTCLSCGLSLVGEPWPDKAHGPCSYVDQEEIGDDLEEEENDYIDGEELPSTCQVPTLMKKPQHPRRLSLLSTQPFSKRKPRRSCCEDHNECLCHEEQGILWSSDCCEEHNANVKADKYKGKLLNAPSMVSNEKPWREGSVSDQDSWGSSGAKYKPKSLRHDNGSQEKMRPLCRRHSCKTFVQRPRRTECDHCEGSEFPCSHRGRGTMIRRGTRY